MTINNIIDELVQSNYNKNNILCIGQSNKGIYAVVIPTIEELICKDNLLSTQNIIIYSVQDIQLWYRNKEEREMWCLQYHDLFSNLLKLLDSSPKSMNKIMSINNSIEIRNFLLNLFARHYKNFSISISIEETSTIDKDIFLKQLTHIEKDAFMYIGEQIGAQGNISVSKMVEKYHISRPVWTNLFKKIQEFHIGEIINKGVKGTYINITHPQLRYEFEHRKI